MGFFATTHPVTAALFAQMVVYLKFQGHVPDNPQAAFSQLESTKHIAGPTFSLWQNSLEGPSISAFRSFDGKVLIMYDGYVYGDCPMPAHCILQAYRTHGARFASHLEGEFSIVLMDFLEDKILLASDTFGTRPLFYMLSAQPFTFSVATCKTSLAKLARADCRQYEVPPNTVLQFQLSSPSADIVPKEWRVTDFELDRQFKLDTRDWEKAFRKAVEMAATIGVATNYYVNGKPKKNVRPAPLPFLMLNEGYNSGAIACSLVLAGLEHRSYSHAESGRDGVGQKETRASTGEVNKLVKTEKPESVLVLEQVCSGNTLLYVAGIHCCV
jgi:hypothetical protein